MELSDWRDVAEIIQAVAFSLAVIGGATWTILTFGLFKQRSRAELELRDLENRSHRQAAVNINIAPSQVRMPLDPGLYLQVNVEAHNTGSLNTLLRLDPRPLWVTEVFVLDDGAYPVGFVAVDGVNADDRWGTGESEDGAQRYDVVVRSGMIWRWSFLVWVPRPGAYHLAFSAGLSPQDLNEAQGAGLARDDLVWGTETYVTVQPLVPSADVSPPSEVTMRAVAMLEIAAANAFRARELFDEVDEAETDPDGSGAVGVYLSSDLSVLLDELKDLRVLLLGPDRLPPDAAVARLESLLAVTADAVVQAVGPSILEDVVAALSAAAQPETA
jgi:hypothetical protein